MFQDFHSVTIDLSYVPLLFSSINGCIIKDKEYAKNRFILYRVGQEVNNLHSSFSLGVCVHVLGFVFFFPLQMLYVS